MAPSSSQRASAAISETLVSSLNAMLDGDLALLLAMLRPVYRRHLAQSGVREAQLATGMDAEQHLCVTCLEEPRQTVFTACGHSLLCVPCVQKLLHRHMGCPVCRAPVSANGGWRLLDSEACCLVPTRSHSPDSMHSGSESIGSDNDDDNDEVEQWHEGDLGRAGLDRYYDPDGGAFTMLILRNSPIGDAGAAAIGALLARHATLTELVLGNTSVGATGAQVLGSALESNATLRELNLNNNFIGDAGAQALGAALASNATLTALCLGNNSIGDSGVQALVAALGSNARLLYLFLWGNFIGDAGAQALGAALVGRTTLMTLELGRNFIGDAGAQALGAALTSNVTLQILVLRNNSISDAGAQALGAAFASNTTLGTLNLVGNSISAAGRRALEAAGASREFLSVQF